MRKIIYFKNGIDSFYKLNPFYKCKFEDISIPRAVIRTIYCPNFKNVKSEAAFTKRILPLLAGGALLPSVFAPSALDLPKIESGTENVINKNITKLILSAHKNKSVNIVIKDESHLPLISNLIPRIEPNITAQCGNTKCISEYLLDEFGISANIKNELTEADMQGRLTVFMPKTAVPPTAGKNFVLNFSGKTCPGSLDETNILYRLPKEFETLRTVFDNNTEKIFSVLEYLSVKTENLNMVIPLNNIL